MWFIQILESIAVIIASIVAIFGINSWRKEMKGKREYELAEEVLTLFYEAKDKISAIRSRHGWVEEGKSRKKGANETPEQKKILDQAYVVFERYQKHQEVFNRLFALRYRFMAVFNQDKVKPFDDLGKIIAEIFNSARRLGRLWQRDIREIDNKISEKVIKDIEKYESIFWEFLPSDPIIPKLNKVIKEIENICRKIIQPKPNWFSRVFKKSN